MDNVYTKTISCNTHLRRSDNTSKEIATRCPVPLHSQCRKEESLLSFPIAHDHRQLQSFLHYLVQLLQVQCQKLGRPADIPQWTFSSENKQAAPSTNCLNLFENLSGVVLLEPLRFSTITYNKETTVF